MTDEDDGVLSRWSRRKRAAAQTPEPAPEPEPEPPEAPAAEALTEEAWLEQNELPEPESLGEGDDFSAYLKDGVPELLRRRALRQLWRANPVLANLDGLVDYGENFTDAAVVPDVIATAYQVGKGIASKIAEELAEAEEPAEEPQPETQREDVETAAVDPEPQRGPEGAVPAEADEESEMDTFRPRRMAFRPE